MKKSIGRMVLVAAVACAVPINGVQAQSGTDLTPEQRDQRLQTEKELESIAIIERKVMVPMRDGVRLATDIYRPKNASGKVPVIWVRTPYNFNFWDVRNGVPADLQTALTAVKHGYAFVFQNERGQFFSEGNWDILGAPRTDGYDAIAWLSSQPWANGKVGTTGCSSTAEYQMGVAAMGHPSYAAMNVQGFGAGVGRVAPYFEQGNWYRGGAFQMLFASWLYGQQNQMRPMFPRDASQEDLIRASKAFDLAEQAPTVDWSKALWHLPLQDILKAVDTPRGIFANAMPVDTGGRMIQRTPNDPAWYKGGLYHDDMPLNVPGLWFMSWYDISVGPNLALYNHVRKTAKAEIADEQWAIIAPVAHCGYMQATEDTIVGERSMGDARLDYQEIEYGFFDRFLKADRSPRLDALLKVSYFTMGINKWQTSDDWPPSGAQAMTLYLSSEGHANSLAGDGALVTSPPGTDRPDTFMYDPMNPVRSYGGKEWPLGAFDHREMEARNDVLVFTSVPFKEGIEVSGPIEPTLCVSSDAKDTDFTVKVLDVYPDGRAYNLDESIQRLRYRDGYDKPLVRMEAGKVYKVTLQPLNTSNYFAVNHRLRLEISSSNFPRFDRNLNTGGNNYDEEKGIVAHNSVHHSKQYPSHVVVTVVKHAEGPASHGQP